MKTKLLASLMLIIGISSSSFAQKMPSFYYKHSFGNGTRKEKSTNDVQRSFNIFNIGEYNVDTLNKYLYNQNTIDFLQSVSIRTFDNTYINAEFASFLFGPVRMGVAGSFKTTKDSAQDEAIKSSIQQIISNGGALDFNFSMPVFFYRSKTEQYHFGLFAETNWALNANIDSSGNKTIANGDVLFSNQSGILLHFDVGSNDQKARLLFDVPCYYVWGSQDVYSQLALPDFSLVQLRIGVAINDLFNLSISGPLYATSKQVQVTPFTLFMQFSPSQLFHANKS